MADYQLTEIGVLRVADQAHIPPDEGNRDWIEYQAWLEGGGTPDPYIEPPEQTSRDANTRLDAGLMAALTSMVAASKAVHAIPHHGPIPARLDALTAQVAAAMDALVKMLQAQAITK